MYFMPIPEPIRKSAEEYYAETTQATSLAEFFGVEKAEFKLVDRSSFAHLIIDPQRYYADPKFKPFSRGTTHTKKRSEKLAKVTPQFRKAGITTAVAYFDWCMSDDFNEAQGGLYKVEASREVGDLLIPKNTSSAFTDRHMHEALQARGVKNLFVSGFNACACVYETVREAIPKNYKVVLLEDCIGQDNNYEDDIPRYMSYMMKMGAQRSTSVEALKFLRDF